ncbi:alpha/beta hydrolase-fold protein [Singulisphaera sp. PoT]|uniref:alpha/beta hydrolase-fold protein n=1 Tax=Singulisphaera sp. PoT TaxID=3411797 RepID=UPI003BF54C76
MTERHSWVSVFLLATSLLGGIRDAQAQPTFKEPDRYPLEAAERQGLEARLEEFGKQIAGIPTARAADRDDALADVVVYHKAAAWAIQLGEFFAKKDVEATRAVLDRGIERAAQLAEGKKPWLEKPGARLLGFYSKVDRSVQPYALIVPEGLPAGERTRLDVVLHGRGVTLNEVRFLQSFEGKAAKPEEQGKLTLHVFGRGNNAYRWAGEADVFEAIEAVKRRFSVDDHKVVLRGFSMGGAGAWHLGLHHPGLWSSVEAGAGFSETRTYAKLGEIPDYQASALHIYDAVDYAANAYNVPMAGYGGEDDPQRQASINIQDALQALGYTFKTEGLETKSPDLDFIRLIGAKTGHSVDPASAKILAAFHDERIAKGGTTRPKHIRFATYTLRFNRAPWLTIEQLQEHYKRASVDAEIVDKRVVVHAIENVAVLSVDRHVAESIRLGDQDFPLESAEKGLLPNVYFRLSEGNWHLLDHEASRRLELNVDGLKRHRLQGPIDDALTGPFLCVRGKGQAWNPLVQSWAEDRLIAFADDWRHWMRGEAAIKDDDAVSDQDIEDQNLILFGDPGSNRVIAKILDKLPLRWTKADIELDGTFGSGDYAPVLIAPNPLNPRRYVVINSGHTFGNREFAGTNAYLFPRLGDFAVFHVDRNGGAVKTSGYFNEKWTLKGKGPGSRAATEGREPLDRPN